MHKYAGEPRDYSESQNSTKDFVEQINEFLATGQHLSDIVMRGKVSNPPGIIAHDELYLTIENGSFLYGGEGQPHRRQVGGIHGRP